MRVNVYHEELTRQSEIVWTEPRPGVRYCGLRIFQRSSPSLHANGTDDDRSAVTFWVGSLDEAEEFLSALMKAVGAERARLEGDPAPQG